MQYIVTPAPHRRQRQSANDMFIYTFIGLVICFMYGFIRYKWPALILLAVCLCPCVIIEVVISSIKSKQFTLNDCSCLVTGMTLACVMPINTPWYIGLLASILAVGIKYVFGGLGNNLFNPSALARSIVGCLFSGFAFSWFGSTTVLQTVLSGDKFLLVMEDLLVGNVGGAVGTCCILIILFCAILLMVLRVIRWENVLFSVVGFSAMVWIFMGLDSIVPMLCSGSFLFATIFMLNDPTTSPYGFSARCIYALIFGVLSAMLMTNLKIGENAVFFALIISNVLSPALDSVFSAFKKGVKLRD